DHVVLRASLRLAALAIGAGASVDVFRNRSRSNEADGADLGVLEQGIYGCFTAVDALLEHPKVRAISFVGSTPVAKYIYARSGANGKRCQAQGGAKNHVIVLPDADMKMATQIISDSAFGCAGQRCLAVSVAITVGEAQKTFRDSITSAAGSLK